MHESDALSNGISIGSTDFTQLKRVPNTQTNTQTTLRIFKIARIYTPSALFQRKQQQKVS